LLAYYEPIIHKFLAVSYETAERLKLLLPHRSADILMRPYGVHVSRLLKRKDTNPNAPLRLTYAGRLAVIQKRIMDLIGLARCLVALNVDFQLRIIGDGIDEEALKRSIAALDPPVRNRILLVGSVSPDRMRSQWRNSDAIILVSEYEGTSISMMEGMACGCVPVVTDVSGARGLVTDGISGFLIPVGDVEGMARRIKELDMNRERLAEMGKKAHASVLAQCSYDEYLPAFLDLAKSSWDGQPRQWPKNRHPVLSNLGLWSLKRKLALHLKRKTGLRRSRHG
jgi:glycosyltransferase involved in cell wall biosynthesis